MAVLIILVVSIVRAFVSIPDERTLELLPFAIRSPLVFTLTVTPFLVLGGFLSWLFFSVLTHGLARLFHGNGSFSSTLLVLAFSELPFFFLILVLPLALLRLYSMPPEIVPLSSLFITLFQLALALWSLVLIIIGLREIHFFSYPRAAGAACLPPCGCFLLLVLLLTVLVVLGLVSTASLLGQ